MAETLSTSSSEPDPRQNIPKHGWPWGLILALLIVLSVEVCVRIHPLSPLVRYQSEESLVQAVRTYIDHNQPADVSLIGSSQLLEGVSMPEMVKAIHETMGSQISVANYAIRNARMDIDDAAVKYILNQTKQPKIVVIAFSLRDFRFVKGRTMDWDRMATFWTWSDFWHEFRQQGIWNGWPILTELPTLIRSQVGPYYHTLDQRDTIALHLLKLFEPLGVTAEQESCPIIGEPSIRHLGTNGQRSLPNSKLSLKNHLARAISYYDITGEVNPNKEMLSRLSRLTQRLQKANIRVIWVEMPIADLLTTAIPEQMQLRYHTAINQLAKQQHVEWLPATDQSFQPTPDDFSDLQHFNLPGAEKFSWMLASKISGKQPTTRPVTILPPSAP